MNKVMLDLQLEYHCFKYRLKKVVYKTATCDKEGNLILKDREYIARTDYSILKLIDIEKPKKG